MSVPHHETCFLPQMQRTKELPEKNKEAFSMFQRVKG